MLSGMRHDTRVLLYCCLNSNDVAYVNYNQNRGSERQYDSTQGGKSKWCCREKVCQSLVWAYYEQPYS